MIIEQIKSRLEDKFRPFTLELSSGKKIRVPHRDFIAVHPKLIAVHPKLIVVIDQKGISHTISPLHVVSIDEAERHH